LVTPSISAGTRTIHATPRAVRSEVLSCGASCGMIVVRRASVSVAPRERATRANAGSSERTPADVPSTIGQTAAKATSATTAMSVEPTSTSTSGVHASGEVMRRNWTTGAVAYSTRARAPSRAPSGTPIAAATTRPSTRRHSDTTIASSVACCGSSLTSSLKASSGPIRDTTALEPKTTSLANHHSTMTTATTASLALMRTKNALMA